MKKIQEYIDHIKEEVDDAHNYAEKYVELKTSNPQWGKMYHDMSTQELVHAQNFKTMGESVYNDIKATYMPEATHEQWEKCLRKYADKVARTKMMLNV